VDLLDDGGEARFVAVEAGDRRALGRETQGGRAADSRGGTGDQDTSCCEAHVDPMPRRAPGSQRDSDRRSNRTVTDRL